jgi:hypothetical protein
MNVVAFERKQDAGEWSERVVRDPQRDARKGRADARRKRGIACPIGAAAFGFRLISPNFLITSQF